MEKNLLSKLDPKGKEHQRKKVLRLFFSWNSKQDRLENSQKFWDWVKNLSPDNLLSSERFKSMSYEFLDKLLSKKGFRETISHWIDTIYLPSLTKSSEDENAKYFLQFIINSINVKQNVETSKQRYLQEFSTLPVSEMQFIDKVETPTNPGVYIEYKCAKNSCSSNRIKKYGYIGIDLYVNLNNSLEAMKCLVCSGAIIVMNIGLLACKYCYSGFINGNRQEMYKDMTNYYNTLDEIHFSLWDQSFLQAQGLSEEEKEFLDNLIFSSFNDPTVPKKKYCKRKGVEGNAEEGVGMSFKAVILGLEKEVRELDSQIYDLVADNYKNSKLVKELQSKLIDFPDS